MKFLTTCNKCNEDGRICPSCGLCEDCHKKKSISDAMDEMRQGAIERVIMDDTLHDIALTGGITAVDAIRGLGMTLDEVNEGFSVIKGAVISVLELIHRTGAFLALGQVLFDDDDDEAIVRPLLESLTESEADIEAILELNRRNSEPRVSESVVDFIDSIGVEG